MIDSALVSGSQRWARSVLDRMMAAEQASEKPLVKRSRPSVIACKKPIAQPINCANFKSPASTVLADPNLQEPDALVLLYLRRLGVMC